MKSHAGSLALVLASIFLAVASLLLIRWFGQPVSFAERRKQADGFKNVSYQLIEDLSHGRKGLWDAAMILHDYAKHHSPMIFTAVSSDATMGEGDSVSRFARSLIRTYRVGESRADDWPGNYPEWITDKLEWEFMNRDVLAPKWASVVHVVR